MAKYVIIDTLNVEYPPFCTETFCLHCHTECNSEHQALTVAQKLWDALTDDERSRRTEFAVIRSDNPDETAPDHLDGAIIKIWK